MKTKHSSRTINRATRPRKRSKGKTTTRVTVDFPIEEHRRLKARAALEGVTLQQYIRSRTLLEDEIANDEFKSLAKKIIEEQAAALKRLADK